MGSRKIKRRAKGKGRLVPVDPQTMGLLQRQVQLFRERFGREPGKDPLFFDPDSFVPRPLDMDELNREAVEAMEKAGWRPELIYAFRKTGLIVSQDNLHKIPASALAEWEAAVEEYFALTEGPGSG